MSTHPFFVNQTPFLPSGSKNTIYSSPSSVYASSSNTHSRTQSSTSVNTLASVESTTSTTSTSSISSTSSCFSRSTPIDRECLRWMQRESDHEHIFGSVSSRANGLSVEERDVRRRAMEIEVGNRTLSEGDQSEESEIKVIKAERRKGRVGKWF
ncbi:hypothetical protein L486_03755 [Kwoniella mangroviensis CBS 10435]|uniref:Uncharacterized protein n=1 Tax=Kwoniella mangroviensis CBS 10435 TaxID=1331196 RepID=A0A1B9IUN7_9TREE|nr:hypothetical protein L486_03755 [Kwoniella mangroviensis CBS 10435]